MLLPFHDVDRHLHQRDLALGTQVLTVVPVAVAVQTAEAVTAMIALMTRSQTEIVVKNSMVRLFRAGMAEVKEAAGNETQSEKKRTRRSKEIETEKETETVLGIGMLIRRKRENATETKIVGKGIAIVNESVTATGIEIDIVEMIKIAIAMSGKSGNQLVVIPLPMLPHRGSIAVYLLVLMFRGTETYQMAMRPLAKEEDPLMMIPTAVPNVALAKIVIEMIEVDDRQKKKAMIDPVILTDAELSVTRLRMMFEDLKGRAINAFPKVCLPPKRYLLQHHGPCHQVKLRESQKLIRHPHVIATGRHNATLLPICLEAPVRPSNHSRNQALLAAEAFVLASAIRKALVPSFRHLSTRTDLSLHTKMMIGITAGNAQ